MEQLKLKNQLCFPLYACAKEVVRLYRPCLDKLDLTYTQYITMLVLWECGKCNVKELGQKLYLDSGTLTPVLKHLEAKGFVNRRRSEEDERVLIVEITEAGEELKQRAASVPIEMAKLVPLDKEETMQLYHLLYKALGSLERD